ncbi:hypothetical protein EDB86DRAFT_2343984 [Lactarius hatsudake]|nr:hypothetical protein EDB86DRAFT_2343984 [Lactarius hatsudake]
MRLWASSWRTSWFLRSFDSNRRFHVLIEQMSFALRSLVGVTRSTLLVISRSLSMRPLNLSLTSYFILSADRCRLLCIIWIIPSCGAHIWYFCYTLITWPNSSILTPENVPLVSAYHEARVLPHHFIQALAISQCEAIWMLLLPLSCTWIIQPHNSVSWPV